MLQKIRADWSDCCVVAASGPSLTEDVVRQIRDLPVIAVNDAYRVVPFARMLYACDRIWWDHHQGCQDFTGEKWSSHGSAAQNNKIETAERYSLSLVKGTGGEGFSYDPSTIHYGSNSGFQAINIAIHKIGGKGRILLVGFDMRTSDGKSHFFGEHPWRRGVVSNYAAWFPQFNRAAKSLPSGLEIVNCTPGSALPSFRKMDLCDALPVAA